MSLNHITTNDWSNADSKRLYNDGWPDEPAVAARYGSGSQCGGCAFFAPFDSDWGLCCHVESRHHLETVFEHFTCPSIVDEHWGPHSFSTDAEFRCRCGGEPSEFWDDLVKFLNETNRKGKLS